MHMNLLPKTIIWRLLLRARIRQWAIVGAIVGLLGLTLAVAEYLDVARKRQMCAALEQSCLPLRDIQTETAAQEARLMELTRKTAALCELAPPSRTLALLGIVARCAAQTEGKLQVQRLGCTTATVSQTAGAPSDPAGAAPLTKSTRERATLQLLGQAENDAAVAQFTAALKQLPVFDHVELKSCSEFQAVGARGRQYLVECSFEP